MGKKTKIDWADATWNPVTGCLHGCEYCYARRIADRFGCYPSDEKLHEYDVRQIVRYRNDDGEWNRPHNCAYPFSFAPTLHRYKLDELQHWKKPRNIFVCSMADLFGDWVPDEWIKNVFDACDLAPQHRYMFLTKNPSRYVKLDKFLSFPTFEEAFIEKSRPEMLLGASATNDEQMCSAYCSMADFVSIEPIQEEIISDYFTVVDEWQGEIKSSYRRWDWVIIGAETGNSKNKAIPKKEWIDKIANICAECGTPVFMKESLREIMGNEFRQEFPWEE